MTRDKVEVEYGRIEARVLLPAGSGVWSAFWSLGTDLAEVGWPETGEIDIMEFVGRKPNTVFGTLHGPGHAGNESYGDVRWYVDDVLYHTATPFDLPGKWVYNDPVFLLLNVAMGGNFGGDVKPGLSLPLSMAVDYVRVYRQLPQAGG